MDANMLFNTLESVKGYSLKELSKLNDEWEARVYLLKLEKFTTEYHEAAKRFCEEVSRR